MVEPIAKAQLFFEETGGVCTPTEILFKNIVVQTVQS
jgi:hypothetical protein